MQIRNPLHIAKGNIGVTFKGGKIRKVGDSGQADHRNINELALRGSGKAFGETVLIVNIHVGIGDDPRHRNAAQPLQDLDSRFQNGPVPSEFVDNGALDPGTLVFLQQGHSSIELGKDPAPVNIAHQQHRGIHQLGKPHVHNVVLLQIDLRRASGPFDDDNVIFRSQAVVGLQNGGDVFPFSAVVLHSTHISLNLTGDDDLASHIGGWLEQNGVHPHIRGDPGCLRLNHLGPAHLPPILGNEGVQRHVLTLEGGNPIAILFENTAKGSRQQAFARIGHGALNHNVLCHAHTSFIA